MIPSERNLWHRLAGTFIENRELGVLFILGIVAFGVLGFVLMPKQYNPEIVAPAFRVVTAYPGATVDEVYETITRPLEDRVRELRDVDDIYARSEDGRSIVTVTFAIGSDKHAAKVDLVQRLRSNMDQRPAGATDPTVEEIDPDDVPVVVYALTSTQFSDTSLRAFAQDLADRLSHVTGAATVTVRGGRVQELRITANPDRMTAVRVTTAQIAAAVAAADRQIAGGVLEGEDSTIAVRVFGDIVTPEALAALPISGSGPAVVRIGDVATVTRTAAEYVNHVALTDRNGRQDAVYVGIAKHPGTNATVVARDIATAVAAMTADGIVPSHVTLTQVRDDGAVASQEIGGLTVNMVQSVAIVTLVLLVFLSTRSALVVAVAIPLTLLAVFGVGMLAGQTINRITLFALILSLGLLVDSATVVVENMVRLLRARKPYEDRAEVVQRSVGEVGMSLVMSTVTTVLAFIPMAYVTGMMGPYMGPIPFFVPVALVVSLLIALTVNPFLGYLFLRDDDNVRRGVIGRLQSAADRMTTRLQEAYVRLLGRIFTQRMFRRTVVIVIVGAFLVAIALPAVGIVRFRMLPKADRDQFFVYVDLPTSASLVAADDTARRVTDMILTDPLVRNVQSYVGTGPVIDFNGLFKGADGRTGRNQATLQVNLVPKDNRDATSEDIATAARHRLADRDPDIAVTIVEDPPGPPVLATFQLKVQGTEATDTPMLAAIARDLMPIMRGVDGVTDLDTSLSETGAHLDYRIDSAAAAASGVMPADVFRALEVALHGAPIGVWHVMPGDARRANEERQIVIRLARPDRDDVTDLSRITVPSTRGVSVPLSAVLVPVDAAAVAPILGDARRPTVYVNAEMQDRSVVYASIDTLRALLAYRLPDGQGTVTQWSLFGVTYRAADGTSYDVRLGGEWELTLEVFRDMGMAFGVAILAIYFVLVAQFRSLRIPLYVMATIPLALIGVLPGFALLGVTLGTYFTATSMIGVIALAGIVVNNAIIYLEYVMQLRAEQDLSLDAALMEAGRTRLLPIALTSATTILGSLTIIADPVWEGLAWSIVWGLSLSAFLTLVVLPVIYRKFEK